MRNGPAIRILLSVVYILILLVATNYKYRKPAYNWDMVPYIASVVSIENKDPRNIHAITYREVQNNVPASTYESLTHSGNLFRDKALSGPTFLYEKLPFYVIKPAYILLIFILYKLGISLVTAVFIPSCLSYFGIGLLIFFWLRRHVHIVLAMFISVSMLLSAPIQEVGSIATPDCLSACAILYSFYFLIERKNLTWGYIFLLVSILTRIDNVLIAIFVITFVALGGKWSSRIPKRQYLLMICGIALAYFVVAYCATPYGWSILFFPSFFTKHNEAFPLAGAAANSLREYLFVRYVALMVCMKYYHLFTCLAFPFLLFVTNKSLRWKNLSFIQAFMAMLIIFFLTRLILFTDLGDRHFVAYIVLVPILLAIRFSQLVTTQAQQGLEPV
jgi:hypothetical protein